MVFPWFSYGFSYIMLMVTTGRVQQVMGDLVILHEKVVLLVTARSLAGQYCPGRSSLGDSTRASLRNVCLEWDMCVHIYMYLHTYRYM